mmetsp:Transcript_26056/g.39092  ORF Transcript_26056/g.39092 Transcript_26056/m.39092 type:complete len:119 (+) Transcript_26056:158-514(+)
MTAWGRLAAPCRGGVLAVTCPLGTVKQTHCTTPRKDLYKNAHIRNDLSQCTPYKTISMIKRAMLFIEFAHPTPPPALEPSPAPPLMKAARRQAGTATLQDRPRGQPPLYQQGRADLKR